MTCICQHEDGEHTSSGCNHEAGGVVCPCFKFRPNSEAGLDTLAGQISLERDIKAWDDSVRQIMELRYMKIDQPYPM